MVLQWWELDETPGGGGNNRDREPSARRDTMRRTIEFIYIDSGGGHRAAAQALAEVIERQQRPWDIRMVCIQDLFDSIDVIRKSTGIPFQDVYNIMLQRGWTLGSAQLVPLMHGVIRLLHRSQVKVLAEHWAETQPDMVVSLIPHYNRAFREALDSVSPVHAAELPC